MVYFTHTMSYTSVFDYSLLWMKKMHSPLAILCLQQKATLSVSEGALNLIFQMGSRLYHLTSRCSFHPIESEDALNLIFPMGRRLYHLTSRRSSHPIKSEDALNLIFQVGSRLYHLTRRRSSNPIESKDGAIPIFQMGPRLYHLTRRRSSHPIESEDALDLCFLTTTWRHVTLITRVIPMLPRSIEWPGSSVMALPLKL